jgi:YHS domain-containing protein
MGSLWRKWWIYPLGALVLVLVALTVLADTSSDSADVSTSQFLADVQARRVTRIEVDGRSIEYTVAGGSPRTARLERGDAVRDILADAGIEPGSPAYPVVVIVTDDGLGGIANVIFTFLPVFIILGILFVFWRQAMKVQNRPPFSLLVTNFDPVCRNTVNPGSAGGSSNFMTTTYYFCSAEHKQQFDADPTRFLLQK